MNRLKGLRFSASLVLLAFIVVLKPSSPSTGINLTNWGGDQLRPAISHNLSENEYIIVWEDHTDPANWEIHGGPLDYAGLHGAVNITFESSNPTSQLAPDVAINATGSEYMVIFEDTTTPLNHDIEARLLSATNPKWFTVSSLPENERNPAIATDTRHNNYLVVWEKQTGYDELAQFDILAQRITADGNILDNLITIDDGEFNQLNPAIAYNSSLDAFLVVWQDYDAGNWDIMGRIVYANGSTSSEITIEPPGHDQVNPDIAYNSQNNEFLVVWEDRFGVADQWDIKGWRLDGSGNHLDWYMISELGTQRRKVPSVTYKSSSNEYMVVFEFEFSESDIDVLYCRMKGDGVMLLQDYAISNAWGIFEGLPVVAAGSMMEYLVVWEDGRNQPGNMMDIYANLWSIPITGLYLPIVIR